MTVIERMRAVLRGEAAAILAVTVTPAYEAAVAAIIACRGKVVTLGMGKAGLIARKCAATLASTGTPAIFLHPGEAAHGDLGVVGSGDVLIAFSNSGRTAEVLEAIAAARALYATVTVVGITGAADSPLSVCVDVLLVMGPVDEPCPLGLTPSASTTVMLAIADALALAALELKGFRRADFGARHRGGYLGQLTSGVCG